MTNAEQKMKNRIRNARCQYATWQRLFPTPKREDVELEIILDHIAGVIDTAGMQAAMAQLAEMVKNATPKKPLYFK